MTKLQELFNIAATNVKGMFDKRHEILPMWHVVMGNDEHVLIATPWSNDDEKDAAVDALRKIFRQRQAKRLVFICEAWTLLARSANEISRPSEHPDRREVVSLIAEDRDGSNLAGWYFILRPEHGPPTLSPLHMSDATESAGRMVGLLD